jgi:SMI1 / KNR4 family (SUKH-1)
MVAWHSVFDEAHPVKGASAGELELFVASVSQPLTPMEIEAINRSQRNPFPEGDPLHAPWRPFDPSVWVLPNRPLPASYLDFLTFSNGGEFCSGDWRFQFFPALGQSHGVRAMMLAYHVPEYMPSALPFAFDGAGGFYLFDMRQAAKDGEYPVVISHSGELVWSPDESGQIAETFYDACRGAKGR